MTTFLTVFNPCLHDYFAMITFIVAMNRKQFIKYGRQ